MERKAVRPLWNTAMKKRSLIRCNPHNYAEINQKKKTEMNGSEKLKFLIKHTHGLGGGKYGNAKILTNKIYEGEKREWKKIFLF